MADMLLRSDLKASAAAGLDVMAAHVHALFVLHGAHLGTGRARRRQCHVCIEAASQTRQRIAPPPSAEEVR